MVKVLKKGVLGSMAVMLMLSGFLVACSNKDEGGSTATTSPSGSNTTTPSKEPEKPAKIRVTLWDRANAPEGQNLGNNPIIKYVIDETKKVGLDVEFVSLPRAQESEKLNVWMASGEAPDIILTYSMDTIFKYAEQGGLWELDSYLAKYPDLIKNNKLALDQVGMYKGKRYAIPALKANTYSGPNMKIRKDWLDALGMKNPTTNEELYQVLKAFKEKDPGNVGKDKVIPWALPAINQSMKAFYYGPMFGFGVNMDGPSNQFYAPDGNYKNGVFTSSVATPEGKAYYQWMNKVYKEGLISKEFVTDVNSQQFTQQVNSGVAGFVDSNDTPWNLNVATRKSVPTATWVPVEPFKRPDGTQLMSKVSDYSMLVAVPKSSKNPDAVLKYLNWMVQPKNLATVQSGIEGVNWKDDGGVKVQIDPELNKKTTWVSLAGDLAIVQQGGPALNKEQLLKSVALSLPDEKQREEYANSFVTYYDIFKKFGKPNTVIDSPRPVAQKTVATIEKSLYEGVSKVIISTDFEKTYAEMLGAWERAGGKDYDKEISDAYKTMKK
ncbi:extracellular solute-binding protein [Paenibacillus sp. LMG 31461]|uniref:Extracellular solute-binding protein n=1 Tax=Paenibacillus plantarum TaxID=2654975 RepID=A0ABX1XML4_9BACL|nr:extracellular solute-binding protein [Paenibacillus plantarum]NOU69777.1 extracellular solute-binding protein [Paenibacillus plantarum]